MLCRCAAGSFYGSESCQPCNAGTYGQSSPGVNTSCTTCETGKSSAAGATVCCGAGTYAAPNGVNTCLPCSAGLSSSPGALVCCSPGTYTLPGLSLCWKCISGKYSPSGAACLDCPGRRLFFHESWSNQYHFV